MCITSKNSCRTYYVDLDLQPGTVSVHDTDMVIIARIISLQQPTISKNVMLFNVSEFGTSLLSYDAFTTKSKQDVLFLVFLIQVRYTNSSTEIPEFPIAPEIALELLASSSVHQ